MAIDVADAGPLFCANARLRYDGNLPTDKTMTATVKGLLMLENPFFDQDLTLRLKLSTIVFNDVSGISRPFVVKLCGADPSEPCRTTGPLTCFYDVIRMGPGEYIRVEPHGEDGTVPLEFQAVRDEHVQYFDAGKGSTVDTHAGKGSTVDTHAGKGSTVDTHAGKGSTVDTHAGKGSTVDTHAVHTPH
jgi:hypothetical protein